MDSEQSSTTSDKSITRRHYHNHSADITLWMTNSIKECLEKKNCEIVLLNVMAEIFVKMEKMQILNTVTCKYKKDGELKCLEGYTNTNKKYENSETKWLVNEIKELECKALLKFGGVALDTIEKSYSDPVDPKHIEKISNKGVLNHTLFLSETPKNIIEFLTEEKYIKMWILNGNYSQSEIKFDNVVIKNIHHTLENCTVLMEFKWNEWEEFSKVELKLIDVGDNTKVELKQSPIPLEMVDNVRAQWENRIFMIMGRLFNFTFKKE